MGKFHGMNLSKLLRIGHVGQTVTISGWVQMSREPGQFLLKMDDDWTTQLGHKLRHELLREIQVTDLR